MALNFVETDTHQELAPRITVFGVGGAGGNAVNNMIDKQLEGVDFVVANTDAQALQQSKAPGRIQMGVKITEGLGAGARPSVGCAAAEETIEEIIDHLAGSHMCFITAGMGGGTGTGAAPIIAQAARELGVLTVGVVTKPFQFEGAKRMRQAEEGVDALQKVVDTLIIIPNQNLFRLANEKTTFTEAFAMADDVLYQGVKGVTDLMVRPGLINLDFADVRAVMDEMGKAMMGTGEATGEDRAVQAAEKAIANPLLDEISLHGARGVLINITGGYDLTLFELDEAANRIREKVDPEANIIVGSTLDPAMEGALRVSVVATGIDAVQNTQAEDLPRRSLSTPVPAPERAERPAPAAPQPVEQPAPAVAQTAPAQQPQHQQHYQPQQQAPQRQEQPVAYAEEQQPNLFSREMPQRPERHEPAPRYEQQHPGSFQQREMPAQQPRPTAHDRYDAPAYDDMPDDGFDIDAVIDNGGRGQQPHPSAQFTAPRRQAPGAPSPETLARLQRAVQKAPEHGAPTRAHPAAPAPSAEAERGASRFGIGSLISRMAGHGHDSAPASAQRRVAPPMHQYDEEHAPAASDDRIEIPAFLRRQAN
ncbi:cell division protein FtsZ [Roseinatronobacter alkalisoli]|uniref:Cell division protein FtsZ n=1 Tax=Roseinatronobacter alkalisoli TaxID=3028235 RepID=A0ABT5T4P3_9RHOB|nr:cell division protein FtsZ [Roseinatronobacter sp. HJB301]MDD7970077.1 cell division protein FtsZ [Roseinatronobacter sp. HJB301]